jgi:uncharacterized protein YqeY
MTDMQPDRFIERMQQDMRQALKDRERTKLDELRSLLARISNAEAIALPADGASIAGAAQGVNSRSRTSTRS